MAFDGFINKAVISELKNCLINGKINKVYQPNKDEIIINIYSNSNNYNLDICINSSNCRINLSTHKKPNPINATSFCMLLRKHLIGAKIEDINTVGLDRIVILKLKSFNELNDLISKQLIIELMGKHSNIILLNENNVIIDSARHISSDDRNILPANPYAFPISKKINIYNISAKDFINMIKNSNDFINCISSNFYGFSKTLINHIIDILELDVNNLTDDDIFKFYNYIITLIKNIKINNVECTNFDFNNKKDYVLICSENPSELKINTFLDNYYYEKEKGENFENYRNNVLKLVLSILKKYEKRLNNINSKLAECQKMDKYKLYGELITANLYKIDNNTNIEKITLENYYDNNNLIDIELDKKYSPALNAKHFFKKYNKMKNALEIVSKQKLDTKNDLNYIESIVYSLNSSSSISEVDEIYLEVQENLLGKKYIKSNKKNNIKHSFMTINVNGYTILVGKNNKQNDELTFKVASKSDLWFHAKDIQGSHVILKLNNNLKVTDEITNTCASIAAFYSKAKNSSKVEVQYTEIKNIKKPRNAKPGFVIFNTYNSIIVEPNFISS